MKRPVNKLVPVNRLPLLRRTCQITGADGNDYYGIVADVRRNAGGDTEIVVEVLTGPDRGKIVYLSNKYVTMVPPATVEVPWQCHDELCDNRGIVWLNAYDIADIGTPLCSECEQEMGLVDNNDILPDDAPATPGPKVERPKPTDVEQAVQRIRDTCHSWEDDGGLEPDRYLLDMIVDIRHAAVSEGVDFDDLLRIAADHFEVEQAEHAEAMEARRKSAAI